MCYADDSTLLTGVSKPSDRVSILSSFNCVLALIDEWYKRLCMLVNPIEAKALVVSRSKCLLSVFPNFS